MSQTARRIYVDRSRHLDHSRCPRLRWLGYHAGSQHRGLQPVRKSIHLVIGGAVHVGLETLLRQSQEWINVHDGKVESLWEPFLGAEHGYVRAAEDLAVEDALADLSESTRHGIELDMNEIAGAQAAAEVAAGVKIDFSGTTDNNAQSASVMDSPIMIEFGSSEPAATSAISFGDQLDQSVKQERAAAGEVVDWSKPIYQKEVARGEVDGQAGLSIAGGSGVGTGNVADSSVHQLANQQAATGIDDYLKQELAALVEGMVRAYARRRLRPLLEQFEVLEVEREGQWKLGDTNLPVKSILGHKFNSSDFSGDRICVRSDCGVHEHNEDVLPCITVDNSEPTELWFMSRLDALLLERSTNSLYLQSYKTAGQWDRRKAAEAEIDMQGLSEAVEVEQRLGEWWQQTRGMYAQEPQHFEGGQQMYEFLAGQTSPPRVLGVRYEYLIKGPRRQDDKDAQVPGRYVADSPLIRTYSQAGITADDRRWAASYSWYNLAGQNKRLDYRSWQKVPVWRYMSIAAWIDLLDSGKIQPEAYDKNGLPVDVLADQFVPPLAVFRNDDSMRDMLESLEYSEVNIAKDVAAVQAVEHDPQQFRSELNKRFPQNLSACIFPGRCWAFLCCHGGPDIRYNPESHSDLYQIRSIANHPIEFEQAGGSHA